MALPTTVDRQHAFIFLQVFFGKTRQGEVTDLPQVTSKRLLVAVFTFLLFCGKRAARVQMTYDEVVYRLVELCYITQPAIGKQRRWAHDDFCTLTHEFIGRILERFKLCEPHASVVAALPALLHVV